MDKISKALKRFSDKERKWVKEILKKLKNGDFKDLRTKKLKERKDIYRVRKGGIRIIYRKMARRIILLTVEKRSEHTYRK